MILQAGGNRGEVWVMGKGAHVWCRLVGWLVGWLDGWGSSMGNVTVSR